MDVPFVRVRDRDEYDESVGAMVYHICWLRHIDKFHHAMPDTIKQSPTQGTLHDAVGASFASGWYYVQFLTMLHS